MKRSTTPSFVLELPLAVAPGQERILLGRFEAARRLYNAVLGEALRRQRLMREARAWHKARALKDKKERAATFRKLGADYGFTSSALSSFGTECKNAAGWRGRLGAHETQKVSERAFAAVEAFGFGVRGKPRFKGKNRPLHSIEAKSNAAGIRWKAATGCLEWNGLILAAQLAAEGKDRWQQEALARKTKFCRLVWRNLRGRRRWYIQLLQAGTSPRKHEIATGTVGLDVGPSCVAIVAEGAAALVGFCPTITQPWQEVRRLQRALDRSRRATNPHCFGPDGTWKKGTRQSVFSARYRNLKTRIAEAERRLASERKRSHGELANAILSHGTVVQSEALSCRAFQRRFGRSVKVKAPGLFLQILRRKAESAGGEVRDLNTRTLKMSQYDHPTGQYRKKPLSERWHLLGDESAIVQRDIYSAFLARCVIDNRHHPSHIREMWAAAEPLLRQARWCRPQPASGKAKALPTVKPSERVACRRKPAIDHSPDAVAATREPGNPDGSAFRTPYL
ncbi:hypothetical protein [Geoalkalibacter halelectricus]|uniref:Transposase n=1 Tax=Geoalkalibacter halelectricus TaxID=2847045 RepID=A0ABY5ZNJ9_9BACT|nr:hypothetical protein [Geoalkalibacter halelectricus]MDO3377172.1 hypothetical protein [Geoalkalibacter halelectricus]UWZ79460.1 hypothetical protein L9S41_17515 [Geoalkalibacter halelectricus]